MAKVPITVKGLKHVTNMLAEAGVEAFVTCTSKMKDQDGVQSGFKFTAAEELIGDYGVDSEGNFGLVLNASPIDVGAIGGNADVGYGFTNTGKGNFRLTVTLELFAKDDDLADGPAVAGLASSTAPAPRNSLGR